MALAAGGYEGVAGWVDPAAATGAGQRPPDQPDDGGVAPAFGPPARPRPRRKCECAWCGHLRTTHVPLACRFLDCRCLQFI